MAAERIGRCRCPLCGSDKANLGLTKKQLVCITCNGCNIQLFTRSDNSDRRARALLIPEPQPTSDPAAPSTAPVARPPPAPTAPTAPNPPNPPKPRKAPAWGMFGAPHE